MSAEPILDQRWRFTVDEYELMGQVGILAEDDRVELLDGEIVAMSPIGPKHASVVDRVVELLVTKVGGRASVKTQNPIRLLPRSEPQPDIVLARRRRDFYASAHPTAEDILLLVEVADSTLAKDRLVKVPIYADREIVEVWLVDLLAEQIEVYTDPKDGVYQTVRTVVRGDVLTPGELPELRLPVDDILGD